MDNVVEVGEYSAYVTEAVADFYGPAGQTDLKQPGDAGIAATFTNPCRWRDDRLYTGQRWKRDIHKFADASGFGYTATEGARNLSGLHDH